MKAAFSDDNGALKRFNLVERSLPEMWDALGRVTPIEARTYEQGESVSVLVTQVCKGVAYGYPLRNGVRDRSKWYTQTDTTAVRIPEGGAKIWMLVDMPFDDVDKAIFRADLASGNVVEERMPAPVGEAFNEEAVVTFGKYKGYTVGQLMKKDPSYLDWALENINSFREKALKRA